MGRTNDTLSDQELVTLVLAGDTTVFAGIIRRSERMVAQIVYRMVANEKDREDITQNIYLKAYKNLAGFRFQAKLSTWVARIACNTCINHLNKKKMVWLPLEEDNSPVQSYSEADTALFESETKKILATAIASLPPLYQTLLLLYHNEALPYEEIASITNIPLGTVKSYLYRARKMLQDILLSKYKKEDI